MKIKLIWDTNNKHILQKLFNFINKTPLELMREKMNTDNLLYLNYTSMNTKSVNLIKTLNIREELDTFFINGGCFSKKKRKTWDNYIEEMKTYKFNLDPPGRCIDGYRVFETLIVGTIPIIFSSCNDEMFNDLPVLIIKDYNILTPEFLEEQWINITSRDDYNFYKLSAEYWYNIISSY